MILDWEGHRGWFLFTAVALVAATAAYVVYAADDPAGPRGGSVAGLVYGFTGTALILFAALLGLRKKVPHWQVGSAAKWLKGHLWLGFLSFPLILFHGGFRFGGALTTVLMTLFYAVFLTGILGVVLQQLLPRLMMRALPQETVYEQIDRVRRKLQTEAKDLCTGRTPAYRIKRARSSGLEVGAFHGTTVRSKPRRARKEEGEEEPDHTALRQFLHDDLRPFFRYRGFRRSRLWDHHKRQALFADLRTQVDPELHDETRELESLCEQREQLETQRRMHHWLHGWLYVHAPLSYAMVFLTVVHAVMSLYY